MVERGLPVLLCLQLLDPAAVLRRLPNCRGEALGGLRPPLPEQQAGDLAVPRRQLTHGRVAGQAVGGRARSRLVILLPKAVQPHQVEGIDQLTATGVGGVVGVEELPPVIEHCAAGGGAAGEGVTPRGVRLLVDTGQELVHGRRHVVDPAEGAHNAVFALRVALLGRQPGRGHSPRAGGPGGHVPPVGVGGQQTVHGQHGLVRRVIDVLPVGTHTGPVHEPGRLEGGGVCQLHADHGSHAPGAGLIFVGGAGTVQWQQHPQAGTVRAVLAGGVDAVAAPQGLHPPHRVVRAAAGDAVQVEGQYIPAGDGPGLPPGAVQAAGNVAAHVLQIILLAF